LPTQLQLAKHFGVARETVKRALQILREEQLIATRQGKGAFVIAQAASRRPIGTGPLVQPSYVDDDDKEMCANGLPCLRATAYRCSTNAASATPGVGRSAGTARCE
jgi:DNA-binding transcriptional MocR family regulator